MISVTRSSFENKHDLKPETPGVWIGSNLPVALGTMYYRERPTSTYTDDV